MNREEFEPRMKTAKADLSRLETQAVESKQRQTQHADLKHAIGQFKTFADQLRDGLDQADWSTRREIIRTLVKAVRIDREQVKITYKIDLRPFVDGPGRGRPVQHCRRFAAILPGYEESNFNSRPMPVVCIRFGIPSDWLMPPAEIWTAA